MTVKIDQEKCIGCGLCPALAPEIFGMDYEQGKAIIKKQPSEITENIQSTADSCPVAAIKISKND
jgi:ferredoxin